MLKVELGGGTNPRGHGFVNVDLCATADVRCDLERDPLPFPDDSVAEVYSSHTLEHLAHHHHVLHEVARVCHVGASVELRVPHWLSDMALCAGHRCTVGPTQVRHWTQDFVADWWAGCAKRLDLVRTEYVPSASFAEGQTLFAWLTDEQVMRFVPGTCHEIRYFFRVIDHAP
jgi:hypothetical protein